MTQVRRLDVVDSDPRAKSLDTRIQELCDVMQAAGYACNGVTYLPGQSILLVFQSAVLPGQSPPAQPPSGSA